VGDGWLRSVMESSSEIIKVVVPDGTLRYANSAFGRVFGYDPEEVVGSMNVLEQVHPDDLPRILDATEKALAEGGVARNRVEYRFRHADGSWRWIEGIGTYLQDDPEVGGVVVNARDVTERKEAEAALAESEKRFRSQYENLPVPTFTWRRDPQDFVLVDHNDAARRLAGADKLPGSVATDLFSEMPQMMEMIGRCSSKQITLKREMPWRLPGSAGERRIVVTCVPVDPDLVMVHTEDVTERATAEGRLRFQAQLLGAVGEAVIAIDADRKVVYWNGAAEELYGYTAEEVLGRRLMEHLVPEHHQSHAEEIMAKVRSGADWKGEFVVKRRDGAPLTVEITNSPIFGEDGTQVGVVGVLRNVTERRETEAKLRESEERFRGIFEDAPIGVAMVSLPSSPGADRRYLRVNRALCEMLGYPEEVLLSMTTSEVTHPEDIQKSRDRMERMLEEDGSRYTLEKRYIRSDGLVVWALLNVSLARDSEGRHSHFVAQFQDVTQRKEAEEALRRSEERYRTVVERQTELVCRFLPDLTITFANEAYAAYHGRRPESLVGHTFLDRVHEEGHAYYYEGLTRLSPQSPTSTVEERFFTPDGVRWLQWTDTAIFDGDGRVIEYQSVGRDVTERRELEERLEHQVLHDHLTGLPNRRLLVDRIEQALARTGSRGESRAAVLFMDLDNFKHVNDSLGHEAGDLLLTVVPRRIKECLGPQDTLARFGGDEFVVLIEDVETPDDAAKVAGRIAESFEIPFRLDGRDLYARASIGIVFGDASTRSPEDLLRNADTAMYRAKEAGGGYEIFDPDMHEHFVDRLELENGLRRAVEQDEFVVHYQPIVSLDDGGVLAMEALVRWEHPERGLLHPDEFVPVAEKNGLMVPIGEKVLEEACRRARAWQDERPQAPVTSVNLSAWQLGRRDLAEVIEKTLGKAGLEARFLSLDVTETVYVKTLSRNTAALSRLRALGVGISIDDFGMGYSSLAYLKRLSADALKVDRSFVGNLGEAAEDAAILQTIIELAHTLGMKVVAEGVENEGQASLLRAMGCDFGQGFYFSKPLPPEEATAFLNATHREPA